MRVLDRYNNAAFDKMRSVVSRFVSEHQEYYAGDFLIDMASMLNPENGVEFWWGLKLDGCGSWLGNNKEVVDFNDKAVRWYYINLATETFEPLFKEEE